jgi:cytochrome-b5 reductase
MFKSRNLLLSSGLAVASAAGYVHFQKPQLLTSKHEEPAGAPTNQDKVAFSPNEFRPFTLERTEFISSNSTRQRFLLQSPEHQTGLTVASCIVAKAEIDGKVVVRPYTPISLNEQRGFVELLVKSYPAPGGLMSRHIQSLKPGQTLEMKG